MARQRKIRVTGIRDVIRNLHKLDAVDSAKVRTKAGIAGGNAVMRHAKPEVPKISGNLVRSGTVVAGDDGAIAGFGAEYALRVHEGFQDQDSLGRTYNQTGNPYLVRGVKAAGNEIREDMADVARAEIKRRLPK